MTIRKISLWFIVGMFLSLSWTAKADYLHFIPKKISQPDGKVIECFMSGDEFFNWLHDAEGYTIIQSKQDGYFYYAYKAYGKLIPSPYRADLPDPGSLGLKKWEIVSAERYQELKRQFEDPLKGLKSAPTKGTVVNLNVFLRFQGEEEFDDNRSYYKEFFYNTTVEPSLYDYYQEVSYQSLEVFTEHFPLCEDSVNLSYEDSYPRDYYKPYNQTTNPDGYKNETDKRNREHQLLKRAVEFIADQVPEDVDIDADDDGNVDNVSFIVKGSPGAWSSLLWPHRWSLFSTHATIHGKRVLDYLLMIETSWNLGTLCHEFFHVLGAPDLYHYQDNGSPEGVGNWDIMDNSNNPPQYMGAYMKYKYGKWIDELPEIKSSGKYYINPLSEPENNTYKIASPFSASEYFVVEYREKTGDYESGLPGSGLLVYRINRSAGNGNAGGPPDEVYIYRPDGSLNASGRLNSAQFGAGVRRQINDQTNPQSFLYNGGKGGPGGLNLSDIQFEEDGRMSFYAEIIPLHPPINLTAHASDSKVELDWDPLFTEGFAYYQIYRNAQKLEQTTVSDFTDHTVINGESYSYYVTAVYTGNLPGESEPGNIAYATPLGALGLPYFQDFESQNFGWTIKNQSDGFSWGDYNQLNFGKGNESQFIGANSVMAGSGIHTQDFAISPKFNLADYEEVFLSFNYTFQRWMNYDKLELKFRTSETGGWIFLKELTPTSNWNTWNYESIKLPAGALIDGVQFAFYYSDSNEIGYGAGIDNIEFADEASTVNHLKISHNFNVYPNPNQGFFTLELGFVPKDAIQLEICNAFGKIIYFDEISNLPNHLVNQIDISNHPAGLYFLKVHIDGNVFIKKIIVH